MEEYSPLRWQIGSVTLKRTKALQRSPGETTDAIKKNLFCSEEDALELSSNQTQCSATSEYFSQSSMELSYGLDESRTSKRLFESPSQDDGGWSMDFATPRSSPPRQHPSSQLNGSFCETPPLNKKQRILSPQTPDTDFRPMSLFTDSPASPSGPSPHSSPNMSCDDLMMVSPPRLERLQLYDYPRTPLSIARSSGVHVPTGGMSVQPPPKPFHSRMKQTSKVTRSGPELRRKPSRGTNINPFTPVELQRKSRSARVTPEVVCGGREGGPLMSTPLFDKDLSKPHKKLALRESNISRYREEFHEVCVIGSGSFGTVYKCINRLDGCVYALKRSHKPVAGSPDEAVALREVCAHAVLGSHPHLVRYYSAWAEDNHMLIQNEFCNGGNLSSRICHHRAKGVVFSEEELKRLLRHVCLGLQYIHSMGLVHLDIKPDNIFISLKEPHLPVAMDTIMEDKCSEDQELVYKIGDMGLVTSVRDPQVEEGDCRYLPREILQDNYSSLPKVDIFALGLTAYSAASGSDLPKNGDSWQRIRDGYLDPLPNCSPRINQLLLRMIHPDPSHRPTASQLLALPVICPATQKSKAQLCKELNEEKFKNEMLTRELQEARTTSTQKSSLPFGRVALGGTKLNRSMSIA